MLALLGISTLASLAASLLLGIRLLRMARRTGELPELIMGCAFLGAGVFGYVCMLVGTGGAKAMPAETALAFFYVGYAAISGGVILTYLFVWRVFRPSELWAKVLIGIACPLVAVTALPFALPVEDGQVPQAGLAFLVFWLGHAVRVGSGLWGTIEAGRTWLAMRRRMKLGLAEPVVTNRIGLWGMSSLAAVAIFVATAIANAGGGSMEEVMGPAQILLISLATLASATCQWLAFMPPRRYVAWVGRRAPSA